MHRVRGGRFAAALLGLLALLLAAPAGASRPPLPAGTTIRVSTMVDGRQLEPEGLHQQLIDEPAVSADGRYAVFSTLTPLGFPGCGGGTFLRDLATGRLEMVSVPAGGCHAGNEPGEHGGGGAYTSVSPNGRYVAFSSIAQDLLRDRRLPARSPTGMSTDQGFLRDRLTKRTALVSVGYDGRPANASARRPTVSDDGRWVAIESPATNLARGDTGNPDDERRMDVWLRDLHRGVTVRVGPNARAKQASFKMNPSLSGNGRFVVFDGERGDLAPHKGTGPLLLDMEAAHLVYVWDRVTRRTEVVSRNAAGYAAAGRSSVEHLTGSKISRDGQWVVFTSIATNLVPGPANGTGLFDAPQVYLRDRAGNRTIRVTTNPAGLAANGTSAMPCLSPNGRWVSYASDASDLGDVDVTPSYHDNLPAGRDVYLYDRTTGTHRIVSRSSEGLPGDLRSEQSCVANDGTVVFVSFASTLVRGDTNRQPDVFAHRLAV